MRNSFSISDAIAESGVFDPRFPLQIGATGHKGPLRNPGVSSFTLSVQIVAVQERDSRVPPSRLTAPTGLAG